MLCFARVFLKCSPQMRLLNGESRRSNARAPRAQRRRLLGQSGDHLFICGIRNLGFLWGVVLIVEEVCNLWE